MATSPTDDADGVIYHLTTRAEWTTAQAEGVYARSTRGKSLEEVGFIHCSTPGQLAAVAEFVYAGCDDDLVVLVLRVSDVEASGLDVRVEDGGNGQLYPHVYGPLPTTLVLDERPASFDDTGRFVLG